MRRRIKRIISTVLCAGLVAGLLGGCSGTGSINGGKKIIRVALSQSETHPEYTGMEKFKEVIEEKLGDKYEVQIYPNELLGRLLICACLSLPEIPT